MSNDKNALAEYKIQIGTTFYQEPFNKNGEVNETDSEHKKDCINALFDEDNRLRMASWFLEAEL